MLSKFLQDIYIYVHQPVLPIQPKQSGVYMKQVLIPLIGKCQQLLQLQDMIRYYKIEEVCESPPCFLTLSVRLICESYRVFVTDSES
ncbi:hypothetical protein PoB_005687200 [Plakobranchus ocellatus]|uniref:Uncharacterized protein n=1 Tax=Plakobranchus ocellatus TaxID=259542 RepID=A0AAV4CG61_9GAST|nr:hypothetical protein PoB_005687200 [Plakobranchus ocellatus]